MRNQKTFLSFIGARAGSKGLKGKNTRDFAGKPLIAWSIEASKKSMYVDRTIVSTDGADIAQVAKDHGADVPFLRPAELATDKVSIYDGILHCLDWLKNNEKKVYDYVMLLMPTSPLRTAGDIDTIIDYYFSKKKSDEDTLICAHTLPDNYGWVMETKKDSGYIDFCFESVKKITNRQEIHRLYIPSGLLYIAPTSVMKEKKTFYTDHTLLYPTREEDTIDIDTEEDWQAALKIFHSKKS